MGFKSTLVSEHYGGTLPAWFTEKYKYIFNPEGTLITNKCEFKMYDANDIFKDYQKALIECELLNGDFDVNVVVLAEDGQITKVNITAKEIKYFWMVESMEVPGVWNQGY